MISRLVTAIAVIVMAATPTVRAFCNAECLPAKARGAEVGQLPEALSAHCPSQEGDAPAPASHDGCGHDHGVADSIRVASQLTTVAAHPGVGASVLLFPALARGVELTRLPLHPRGSPARDRSRPLRI